MEFLEIYRILYFGFLIFIEEPCRHRGFFMNANLCCKIPNWWTINYGKYCSFSKVWMEAFSINGWQ